MVGIKVARGLVGVVDGNGEIAVWGRGVVYLQVLESVRGGLSRQSVWGSVVGEGVVWVDVDRVCASFREYKWLFSLGKLNGGRVSGRGRRID